MSFWRRRERAEAAVRRAVQRLDEALATGPSGTPGLAEAYGEAVRTAIDVDPELCLSLVRRVEPRIPREQYAVAFSGADAGWLRRCADDENTAALTVALEVATRLGLTEISRTARDALVDRLAASRDAAELTGQLTHWLALGLADRAVLSRVLGSQVQRAPLTDQAPVWTAFLRRLPDELLPDLFDVHALLDRAGPAIRLADTPDRVRRALALCRSGTDLSVLAAGVALARRVGDQSAVRAVAARAGEVALASGRAEQALDFYTAAGDPAGRSACLEHLGRPFEALEGCPVHRLAALTGECLRRVDAVVAGGDLAQSVRLCRQALTALVPHTADKGAQDKGTQDKGTGRSAIVERQREASAAMRAMLEVARRRFGARLEAGEDAGSVLAEWDRFEEAAGELTAAAELAERGGDVYRAHRLYYQAGRFGEAERVLRVDGSQAGLSARAEARAAGGDRRGAAQLWESAGDWDAAVDLYLEAGDDGAALDCLLRHRRTAALTDPRLATLRRPGNADLLAGLCLQVLDGRSDASSGAQPPASEPRARATGALRSRHGPRRWWRGPGRTSTSGSRGSGDSTWVPRPVRRRSTTPGSGGPSCAPGRTSRSSRRPSVWTHRAASWWVCRPRRRWPDGSSGRCPVPSGAWGAGPSTGSASAATGRRRSPPG